MRSTAKLFYFTVFYCLFSIFPSHTDNKQNTKSIDKNTKHTKSIDKTAKQRWAHLICTTLNVKHINRLYFGSMKQQAIVNMIEHFLAKLELQSGATYYNSIKTHTGNLIDKLNKQTTTDTPKTITLKERLIKLLDSHRQKVHDREKRGEQYLQLKTISNRNDGYIDLSTPYWTTILHTKWKNQTTQFAPDFPVYELPRQFRFNPQLQLRES